MAFVDVISDINTVLYGIAAGIAVLMITFYGIKWKISDSSQGREEAKRGILNVIFGLAIIIIAGNLVGMMLGTAPPHGTTTTTMSGWTTTRMTTTRITTTLPGWTTTSAVITTTTHGTTTTTTLIECFEACIDEGYIYGTCKVFCDDDEVPSEKININCPLGTSCCCKIVTSTTITTTTATSATSTTTTATSTASTTTTSTTIPAACKISTAPKCKDEPYLTCSVANNKDLCGDIDLLCGANYRKDCCCSGFGLCC